MALYDFSKEERIICPACGCPYIYLQEVYSITKEFRQKEEVLVKSKQGDALLCTECDTQAGYIEDKRTEVMPLRGNFKKAV